MGLQLRHVGRAGCEDVGGVVCDAGGGVGGGRGCPEDVVVVGKGGEEETEEETGRCRSVSASVRGRLQAVLLLATYCLL